MSFTYENQGTNTYLVYKIEAVDNVDTMSLGMITNNKIDGIIPTIFTQVDTEKFIKYNISARVSAKEFLSGIVNKKRLIGVFIGVLKALQSAEEYMIDGASLLIDLENIYVDVTKCDAMLVCLPIIREADESVNLPMFFKQIMFSTQFDQTENCDYVAKIINYLNSTPIFSSEEFRKLLELLNQEGGQTPIKEKAVEVKPVVQAQNVKTTTVIEPPISQPVSPKTEAVQNIPKKNTPAATEWKEINVPKPQNAVQPVQNTAVNTEKPMSMFGLLTHYSKENKEIYDRQKAMKKAEKQSQKQTTNAKPASVGFAVPNQPMQNQQVQPVVVAPAQQARNTVAPQVNKPLQQEPKVNTSGNPSIPPEILANMEKCGDFGETTVLGVGTDAGETTVLGVSQAQVVKPYLLRIKNSERIELDKPVFRIGKEKSYVDYFVNDNTAVSRSHVNIINRDNVFFVVDTNSTNHTYVNGNMIQSNVETKLEHGTKLRLANEEFEFFMY